MATFPLFKRLPPEIQDMIWESEASRPRVVAMGLENERIRYAEPHPLLRVCNRSRSACLRKAIGDRLRLQRGSETRELAVDFASDYFFIRATSALSWPDALSNLKRVAISNEYVDICLLQHLDVQELWVLFESEPQQFRPMPDFRRHCYLHHCDRFPAEYRSLRLPTRGRPTGPEKPCPACFWHMELDIPIGDGVGPTLRATLDPSLPQYPTADQIRLSNYPMVGWIRRELECEVMQSQAVLKRVDKGAVACLLEGSRVCVH